MGFDASISHTNKWALKVSQAASLMAGKKAFSTFCGFGFFPCSNDDGKIGGGGVGSVERGNDRNLYIPKHTVIGVHNVKTIDCILSMGCVCVCLYAEQFIQLLLSHFESHLFARIIYGYLYLILLIVFGLFLRTNWNKASANERPRDVYSCATQEEMLSTQLDQTW